MSHSFSRNLSWSMILLTFIALSLTVSPVLSAEITGIAVYPPQISLTTSSDYQHFIVVASRADGVTKDVTDEIELSLSDPSICRVEETKLIPVKDGKSQLNIKHAGHEVTAEITVSEASRPREISFHMDVMPVFTRTGCNTGSCHGAARGKDGFLLSLFGFDPAGDYFRITREIGARRINLALPQQSLMLEKRCWSSSSHWRENGFHLETNIISLLKNG